MTTIAASIKHQSMAADSQAGSKTSIDTQSAVKVFKLTDGRLLGICGHLPEGLKFKKWLEGQHEKPLIKDEFYALVMDKKHPQVLLYSNALEPLPYGKIAAIGSGRPHALTAMDCGLSPAEAVKKAILRDPFSSGRVRVVNWAD